MLQNIAFPIAFALLFQLVFLNELEIMHFLEYKNILNALYALYATCIIITTGTVICVHKSPCSHGFARKKDVGCVICSWSAV